MRYAYAARFVLRAFSVLQTELFVLCDLLSMTLLFPLGMSSHSICCSHLSDLKAGPHFLFRAFEMR